MGINMANRECCDLQILDLKTKAPFLSADYCNTTTSGFTGDTVYATAKGAKKIAYDNAPDGKMSMEFQVAPFKVYSLISDGTIETTAKLFTKETVTASSTTSLTATETPIAGTVYVYAEGDVGGTPMTVTVTDKAISGTFVSGTKYEVCYMTTKSTGVQRVSFNKKKTPKDYYIQMDTTDKTEDGDILPYHLIAYKAKPKRQLELSFSSTGDPATVKIEFDCMEDSDGNQLDLVLINEE